MFKKLNWIALAGFVLAVGCTTDPSTSETAQNATGPATVTTDMSAYLYGDNVSITWSGLTGNVKDWIAIAPQGSALTETTKWAYTGGGTSGVTLLEGPTTGGTFVARAFDNDTFTLMGESDPFTFSDPTMVMATVTSDKTTYLLTDPIIATWTGLPGSPKDWISLAPQGSPVTTTADWLYTNGGTSGSVTFDGIAPTGYPAGVYVLRAFLNDTFTQVGESAPFNVGSGGGPTVFTDKSSYTTFEPIIVNWTGLPGNATDWVSLAPSGSPDTTISTWVYTGGATVGSKTFASGLSTAGSYVARSFINNTYQKAAESVVFTVGTAGTVTISTDQSAYTLGQSVTVTWTGLPGNLHDWISIAPSGSSDTTVTRWVYASGASGSYTFEGPNSSGTYVARAYQNDLYVKLGESTPFTVN